MNPKRVFLGGMAGAMVFLNDEDHLPEQEGMPDARMVFDSILSASTASQPNHGNDWRIALTPFQK
jgi:hypothetical protein